MMGERDGGWIHVQRSKADEWDDRKCGLTGITGIGSERYVLLFAQLASSGVTSNFNKLSL